MKMSYRLHGCLAGFPLSPPSPARGEGGKDSLREES
jgi:hypothetical protein